MNLVANLPECKVDKQRNIIMLKEGEFCRLPEEPKFNLLCERIAIEKPSLSKASLYLSQSLGFLLEDWEISAELKCDIDDRRLSLLSRGISSPAGIFTFQEYTFIVYPKIFEQASSEAPETLLYMIESVLYSRTNSKPRICFPSLFIGDSFTLRIQLLYLLYIHLLRSELLKGAYHEYTKTLLESPRIQGKILVSRQVRKPEWKALKMSQESHPYSIDNTLNRVLKYATIIAHRGLIDPKYKVMARGILSLLSDVATDPYSIWKKISFNRLSERFRILYDLAVVIILMKGTRGKRELLGLLIDMNKLFELYVLSLLKNHLRSWKIEYQKEFTFADVEGKEIIQKPDIVLQTKNNDRCYTIVVDIKYSILDNKEKLDKRTDDIRQIFTYHLLVEKENEAGKSGCSQRPVYSSLVYLGKPDDFKKSVVSWQGYYKVAAKQKCFKIILLNPQVIVKAASTVNSRTREEIEQNIVKEIANIPSCPS
ncbi:MAG: McrC family protein [Desulfurococcales archaeon]|nr:McrC family protein [Desulfurococcales archaeon]